MKIHFIQAYDTSGQKNIGGAINEAILQLNADAEDWIVSMDHDILWLRPDSKMQLADILSVTAYDVLGPRMNRLGNDYQLVPGTLDVTDIKQHIEIADKLSDKHWGIVSELKGGPIAAAVICFKLKTWRMLGGFNEKHLAFDTLFCHRAERSGLRLGVCEGLYIFHLYRMGKEISNIDHLL